MKTKETNIINLSVDSNTNWESHSFPKIGTGYDPV